MKIYEIELESPHEVRRTHPSLFLNFKHGLRVFYQDYRDQWRLGSVIEVFDATKKPRRLIYRIENRPEGDLISDFRKNPLRENMEYRFNFKTISLDGYENVD